MTLYLHIGTSKAGSSALQSCVLANRDVLLEAGICYPLSGLKRESHCGIWDEVRKGRFGLLKRALTETGSSPVGVISCEGFWQLDPIETLVGSLPVDTQVILYLRRPGDYLCSSYRQNIRSKNARTIPPSGHIALAGHLVDYPALLKRWSAHFPLRVRAYEAVKNHIERDFLAAIGAPEDVPIMRRVVNRTPPDGALRLMLLSNRLRPSARKFVHRVIKKASPVLKHLPPIDDNLLRDFGREAVSRWDREVMLRYMSEEDLQHLI